jgi:cytochrome c-type biogenesis protein CcmE
VKNKFLVAVVVVTISLCALVYGAAKESKKPVVTVSSLIQEARPRTNVRVGARVADLPFDYKTTPKLELKFSVRDQSDPSGEHLVGVTYEGPLPETLKAGRDVIIEGNFENNQFQALVLQTQCPSKYEPPKVPGG